jgi:predicted Na+-dependent transporter
MTAISTIASVGMLPLNVFIYSRAAYSDDVLDSLDWNGLGISLAVVISAITLGLLGSYKFGAQSMFFRKLVNKIGNIAGLGLIIFSYLSPEGGQVNISGRPWIFYLATPAPIVLGLISSLIISTLARMKKPERL